MGVIRLRMIGSSSIHLHQKHDLDNQQVLTFSKTRWPQTTNYFRRFLDELETLCRA